VAMIGLHRIDVFDSFRNACKLFQKIDKIFTIDNIIDNPALFYTSHNDMMKDSGSN
jgi:hypothetical protein